MAKVYDAEILPIWTERFARLLLRGLEFPPKAMVLDVGCGVGYQSLEILRRMDEQGRIIAIDPLSTLLNEARTKAGPLSGRRIFFRSDGFDPRLPFDDDVYDLVVSNLGLMEVEDPAATLGEFARVTKPGGRVAATLPLAGTFVEFYDLFREALLKQDRNDALTRLDQWLVRYPTVDEARRWLEWAGLEEATIEHETFTLVFKSSREFFFAPVIEYGPLATWKELAGRGQEMQDIFWQIKEAIDAYFAGSTFAVTVNAACLRGRKVARDELADEPTPSPEVTTGRRVLPVGAPPDEPLDDEIALGTGEIDVLTVSSQDRGFVDDDDEETR